MFTREYEMFVNAKKNLQGMQSKSKSTTIACNPLEFANALNDLETPTPEDGRPKWRCRWDVETNRILGIRHKSHMNNDNDDEGKHVVQHAPHHPRQPRHSHNSQQQQSQSSSSIHHNSQQQQIASNTHHKNAQTILVEQQLPILSQPSAGISAG